MIWIFTSGESWFAFDFPVPVSEVKFFDDQAIVTTSDVAWVFRAEIQGWQEIGPFPGGPVAQQSTSWGSIKAKHR